ncbi:MAG: hypothetical protein JOZ93_02795, partial [Sinobacteraceae bacterium]|nr:hypothetical protein [Nevskiaceae bacterium]
TMRSNLSVGMPIDLICYERDTLRITVRHRFGPGDSDFSSLSRQWSGGVRSVFRDLAAPPMTRPAGDALLASIPAVVNG